MLPFSFWITQLLSSQPPSPEYYDGRVQGGRKVRIIFWLARHENVVKLYHGCLHLWSFRENFSLNLGIFNWNDDGADCWEFCWRELWLETRHIFWRQYAHFINCYPLCKVETPTAAWATIGLVEMCLMFNDIQDESEGCVLSSFVILLCQQSHLLLKYSQQF